MKRLVLVLTIVAAAAACGRSEKSATLAKPDQQKPPVTQSAPPAQAEAAAVDVGARMPDYSSSYLDGSKFDLAEKRDKVVLLNAWATWCGPCRFEIPELQAIHDKYAARGLEVVGVSLDEGDPAGVKAFVAEHKMTYPIVLDSEGKLANVLQTSVLPTTVLVDHNGNIVWKKIGAIMPNDTELTAAIDKAL